MLINRRSNVVGLTGGLGNQLFQLAYALSLSEGDEVYLDAHLGSPRVDRFGEPDIHGFNLPSGIVVCSGERKKWFLRKLSGYLLGLGLNKAHRRRFSFINLNLLRILFVTHLHSMKKIIISEGVGFDSSLELQIHGGVYFGYFQTHYWAAQPRVKRSLMSLTPRLDEDFVGTYRNLSAVEKPLIVHIRLGDYRLDSQFGHLDSQYYLNAISHMNSLEKFESIWLFSDEPELAVHMLKGCEIPIRVIDGSQATPASVLEVMRYGYGYVISNSTFSWWGAYLSHKSGAPVIAPNKWFNGQPEPINLIPSNWMRSAT